MNEFRFDDLLSRYLDESLSDAEERELHEYLSNDQYAARFHEAVRLHNEIAGLLAGCVPDGVMIGLVRSDLLGHENPLASPSASLFDNTTDVSASASPRRRTRTTLLALAAALVCLLAVAATFFRGTGPVVVQQSTSAPLPESVPAVTPEAPALANATPAPTPIAPTLQKMEIASVHGEVYLVDDLGPHLLTDGRPLEGDATIKVIGKESGATLALADGTQIVLMEDTSFSISIDSGKRRLFLNEGALSATVARQPDDSPLVFETVDAIATVRGTELIFAKGSDDTFLIVTKGAVALQRAAGGPEVLIEAGYYGHAENGPGLHPWPIARLPKAQQALVNRVK